MASTRGVECSCRGFSQRGLEFRESLFDWIEVIGWQIAHCRAGLLDCFLDAFDFVAGKIVHDDDIACRKTGARKYSKRFPMPTRPPTSESTTRIISGTSITIGLS